MMIRNFTSQELRLAILTNQLAITLQPKVCLKTFQVIGYEALLRWNHPRYGLIPANQWIRIAEERKLINHLTSWLISQIATFLSQSDSPLPIAINISPASMTIPYVNQIIAILRYHKVPSHLITLELTESLKVENYNIIAGSINMLRREGIRISLDDFGTGYNSLKTLVELEVDEIKIDKSLIQSDHPNSTLILATLANLAKEINIDIVCEGIENNTHLNRAIKINAQVGQGYLFGKPEPINHPLPASAAAKQFA
ncbi:EAL domain-containing protein [Candidatus Odyssella thessalonicensis]|uniref:EAL domain-containing protein n=1 Tax=Candidatus Odyssella thessalonicensis TaxID=84647 RepID=UPI00031955E2|nr:EAL domain-containing protein [Candidatus Odyssella thessalonicensis]